MNKIKNLNTIELNEWKTSKMEDSIAETNGQLRILFENDEIIEKKKESELKNNEKKVNWNNVEEAQIDDWQLSFDFDKNVNENKNEWGEENDNDPNQDELYKFEPKKEPRWNR